MTKEEAAAYLNSLPDDAHVVLWDKAQHKRNREENAERMKRFTIGCTESQAVALNEAWEGYMEALSGKKTFAVDSLIVLISDATAAENAR